ncbi:MAG: helix-turn-helix domain-containing protein [Saccharofermentans sp.]|nr:helix-turn-helix domain-containing protein [Saccharofermentans sp.]
MSGIGANIEFRRKRAKKSRREVCEAIGISEKTLYRYERMLSSPKAEDLKRLVDYFRTDIDSLYKGIL